MIEQITTTNTVYSVQRELGGFATVSRFAVRGEPSSIPMRIITTVQALEAVEVGERGQLPYITPDGSFAVLTTSHVQSIRTSKAMVGIA